MDNQNDLGAENNAIKKQIPEDRPIAINPPITTFSVPLIRRRWVRVTACLAIIVAAVTFIGVLFEIPNSVMNWFINAKTLVNGERADSQWKPPELPKDCKTVFVALGNDQPFTIDINELRNGKPYPLFQKIADPLIQKTANMHIMLKENRLFVLFPWAGAGDTNYDFTLIYKEGDLDSRLQFDWQYNCGAADFEIVNQDESPVFQVRYIRPNFIRLNYVFSLIESTNLFPFKKLTNGTPVSCLAIIDNDSEQFVYTNTADFRKHMLRFTNHTIFRYPMSNHKGEYRNSN
ncbi:MAG: hypothetical protein PHY43_07150 [Verrucomicrobiales bacterium]|nr:hypothetical protein [Verrucomicrobiales bacterium]